MKKTILLLLCLLSTAALSAALPCDTVITVVRPDSVVISETDSTFRVAVHGRDKDKTYHMEYGKAFGPDAVATLDEHASKWDFGYPFKKEGEGGKRLSVNAVPRLEAGVLLPVGRQGGLAATHAFMVGLEAVSLSGSTRNRLNVFSVGFGLEASFPMKVRGDRFWEYHDGCNVLVPYPEGSSRQKSRLSYAALTLPLRYRRAMGRELSLGLSVIPAYVAEAQVKNTYRVGVHEVEDEYKHLGVRRFNLSFALDFKWKNDVGLFVKYCPFDLFGSPAGPDFKSLTIGFLLF